MNKIRQLHLIPITLSAQLRTMQAVGDDLPEGLTYCLHHGEAESLSNDSAPSLTAWQVNTLRTLPEALRPTGMAAAALTWHGEGGIARSGTWMHITLMHFSAGLNDVQVIPAEQVDEDQVQQLMSALQPLLSLSGFELHRSNTGQWYLWCESVLDAQTPVMERGMSTRNYDLLPSGRDAALLRRLLTEIQMTLHQHPINQQREAQGLSPLNGAWLSGAGALTPATSGTLQRIMSDQAYVQGLCEQVNASCWSVPSNVDELLQLKSDDMVLAMRAHDATQFDTQWLQPLLQVINRDQIEYFHLYLDHVQLTLKGGRWHQLRRKLSAPNHKDIVSGTLF